MTTKEFGLEKFKRRYGKEAYYAAGAEQYKKNFTRDGIIAGMLARNTEVLKSQLLFSAARQGTRRRSHAGEVPGIIHHEFPAAMINGRSTRFNASDATALFLIGHEVYQELTRSMGLATKQRKNIERAAEYIVSHLQDDLFTEDPHYAGAKHFALKVTYWKDSALLGRASGEPHYPVVYFLAHAINMRGLRSAAWLLQSKRRGTIAERMAKKLLEFFDEENGVFPIAKDMDGIVRGVSSDSLHMLFYLSPRDLPSHMARRIERASRVLETPIGYRTLEPELAGRMKDAYHAKTVWPFEQAVIANGAHKFRLFHAEHVAKRVYPQIKDSDQECFYVDRKGNIVGTGNPSQLWTAAARIYFESGDVSPLLET